MQAAGLPGMHKYWGRWVKCYWTHLPSKMLLSRAGSLLLMPSTTLTRQPVKPSTRQELEEEDICMLHILLQLHVWVWSQFVVHCSTEWCFTVRIKTAEQVDRSTFLFACDSYMRQSQVTVTCDSYRWHLHVTLTCDLGLDKHAHFPSLHHGRRVFIPTSPCAHLSDYVLLGKHLLFSSCLPITTFM